MIQRKFTNTDDVLEYAAQLIEESDFGDIAGIMAKRKRDREDAALRFKTIEETRKRCAEHIRAMKSRRDLDAREVLRWLADLPADKNHAAELRHAWPLAWKGWLRITCILQCNSNTIPPATEYRIALTDKGHEILAEEQGEAA